MLKKTIDIEPLDLIDVNHGTVYRASVQTERVQTDANFSKIWLKTFITTVTDISNAKMKVAFWIIENLNSHNEIPYTQRDIARLSGFSLYTVTKAITALQRAGFLRKIPRSRGHGYMVNPNCLFRGDYPDRMLMVKRFETCNQPQRTPEQELQEVNKSIDAANKVLKKLTSKQSKLHEQICEKQKEEEEEKIEEFIRRQEEEEKEYQEYEKRLEEKVEAYFRKKEEEERKEAAEQTEEPQIQQAAEEPDDTKRHQHE